MPFISGVIQGSHWRELHLKRQREQLPFSMPQMRSQWQLFWSAKFALIKFTR